MIFVEGTQSLEGGSEGTQRNVAADDGDDVAGFLDLLFEGNPIFRQETPAAGRGGNGKREPMLTTAYTQAARRSAAREDILRAKRNFSIRGLVDQRGSHPWVGGFLWR